MRRHSHLPILASPARSSARPLRKPPRARASRRPLARFSNACLDAASACTMLACCRAIACWSSAWRSRACYLSSAAPIRSASASTYPSTPWCSPRSPSSMATRCVVCAPASSTRLPVAPAARALIPRAWSLPRHRSTRSRMPSLWPRRATTPKSSVRLKRKRPPRALSPGTSRPLSA